MVIHWSDLFTAIALLLMLEGILPFLAPSLMRSIAAKFTALVDRQMRSYGFALLAAGVILLSFVR